MLKDLRIKISYELKYDLSYANNNFSNKASSINIMSFDTIDDNVIRCNSFSGINDVSSNITQSSKKDIELLLANYSFLTKKIFIHELAKYQIIKKGKVFDLVLENLLLKNENN
jgi:hypothetical protein